MSIENLIRHKERHRAALTHFRSLITFLENIEPEQRFWVPISTDPDQMSFTIAFTNTKIGCKYSYVRGQPKITYGYFLTVPDGREEFNPVTTQLFDHLGNLTNSVDNPKFWEYSMLEEDYDQWFYPKIFEALEAAWDVIEPTTPLQCLDDLNT